MKIKSLEMDPSDVVGKLTLCFGLFGVQIYFIFQWSMKN